MGSIRLVTASDVKLVTDLFSLNIQTSLYLMLMFTEYCEHNM